MVQGSRSKSRKNINPRRREEGYVLTQGGAPNPNQPNPRVVRPRSSSSSSSSSRNGKTDGEKYHASKSTATVPRRDDDARVHRSDHHPDRDRSSDRVIIRETPGVVRLDARERRTRAHPRAATRSRGKRKRFIHSVAGGLFSSSSSSSSSEFFPFPPSLPFPRIELGPRISTRWEYPHRRVTVDTTAV